MESQIAQTIKGPVEYTLLGSGPLVLVCHGTSSNCFSTELADPLIEAGFSVLTPSRPGYGRTPLTVGQSAADAAAGLNALLDNIKVQTCAVLAISGGGPMGVALAAMYPQRITRLVLAAAITHPEDRPNEPAYKNQTAFYGPLHNLVWGMLSLMSRLSPRSMARQTLEIFSTYDPEDGLNRLSAREIEKICRFYHGHSSRKGALNDLTHAVGADILREICQPALVIHSREDKSVPFAHAEWSLSHIPQVVLCEAGITGHFFWVGPDYEDICRRMITFLKEDDQ
jgi:pimeloyl-ACP methyl ester carboxylesterase